MKIWVVKGSTGEYDDYEEWDVIAYKSEVLAKMHCDLAAKNVENLNKKINENINTFILRRNYKNPYDKHMIVDYTGVFYKIKSIELSDVETKEEFEEEWFIERL